MRLFIFLFLSLSCFATEPGNSIKVSVPDEPNGKFILVVPAKKYSMKGELFQKLSKEALKASYTVLQFDWIFFSNKDEPSKRLNKEAKELVTLIDFFQNKYKFKLSDLFVVAKSFGSRVLSKIETKNLGPIVLLTPNCDRQFKFLEVYGKLLNHKQGLNISISVNDPYCDIEQIYDSAKYFKRDTNLYTTFGDHNFISLKNSQNQEFMVKQLIHWIKSKTQI